MPENMSISVNGQSQVPPGFRFHPTEEELLQYYLKKKISSEQIDLDVIRDVDLNKLEPWDIQEMCKIGSTPQNDWYFFSHKDKKYPTGTRTNRATSAGFWKATGRDKVIYSNSRRIGMRKTLVFYKGRAPHGQKSDWIMHEYRLDDIPTDATTNIVVSNAMGETTQEEGWVVCRIFKKKILHKTIDISPMSSSIIGEARTRTRTIMSSSQEGSLEQILQYMDSPCEEQNDVHDSKRFLGPINPTIHDTFMKLPSLESPNCIPSYQQVHVQMVNQVSSEPNSEPDLYNWAALDRFVASRLNGQTETSKQLACSFNVEPNNGTMPFSTQSDHEHLQLNQLLSSPNRPYQDYNINEFDLRSFARSTF